MKTTNEPFTFKDFMTKNSYSIPSKLQKTWPLYQHRYTLGISMGILLWTIGLSPLISGLITAIFLIFAEIRFRKNFIPQCNPIKNNKSINETSMTKQGLILNAVLYFVLSFGVGYMVVINNLEKLDLSNLILGAVSLGSMGLGISYLIASITQTKKHL